MPLELLPGVVELGQQGAQVLACPGEGVSAAGGEPRLLLTVNKSLSSQVGQSVGEDFVAQRRQPGAELSKRARAVHQVAQQQGGPSSADRAQRDLHRAVRLWTPGFTSVIRDQFAVPLATFRLVSGGLACFSVWMDDDFGSHDTRIAFSTDAAQHPEVFAAAFNSGNAAALESVYEDLGVLVSEPGQPMTGLERAAANARFQRLGLPIDVRPRHVYVADDIALLIVDWAIEGTGPDGAPVRLRGTATDVARRGPEGTWRYIIDNPFGTA